MIDLRKVGSPDKKSMKGSKMGTNSHMASHMEGTVIVEEELPKHY